MPHFYRLLLFLGVFAIATNADSIPILDEPHSKDNSNSCDCYITSGPDAGYFQYHRFFDFRNISSFSGDYYLNTPANVTANQDQSTQNATSGYLQSTEFTNDWSMQSWSRNVSSVPSVSLVNSLQNIYVMRNRTTNSTYLTFRTVRLENFMSSSEMESMQKNVLHASFRIRLRIIPSDFNYDTPESNTATSVDAGAVAGFFTFYDPDNESDIEILTKDPVNHIRYSNQPDVDRNTGNDIPGASTDVEFPPGKAYTEWIDHRLDWFPDISRYWIDDQLLHNKTYGVPTKPSSLTINLWGDGGEWSGNMTVGGQVLMGIEWIEMVFNTSGPVTGPPGATTSKRHHKQDTGCKTVCTIDDVANVGFPEVVSVSNSTSAAARFPRIGGGGSSTAVVVVSALIGAVVMVLL